MKTSLVLPAVLAGQLISGSAWAQSSRPNVTVLRMSGPQLGVRLEEVDGDVVSRLRLKEEKGALVTSVLENSAAEKAGLKQDDVILKFQGESVLTAAQLSRLVKDVPAGRKVDLDIVRAGAPLKLTATLQNAEWSSKGGDAMEIEGLDEMMKGRMGSLDDLKFKSRKGESFPRTFDFKMDENGPAWKSFGPMTAQLGKGRLGITYTEIEGQLAAYFKAPKENAILVNSVAAGSAAEKAGIKAGDVITKLGRISIEEAADLRDAVSDLESGHATALTVIRDGRSMDLSVTVEDQRRTRNEPATRWRKPVQ